MHVVGFISNLLICSTGLTICSNVGESNDNFFKPLCKIFSIGRNFEKLRNTNSKDYSATHLAKIVFILFIIYGHRIFYTFGFPTSNAIATERVSPLRQSTYRRLRICLF